MSLRWFGQLVKRAAHSSRPGDTPLRCQRGFRPQLEELEDRRVLSSLQPAVISYPTGPIRGANLHANVSVISIPTGPCAPSSLFPTGPAS